MCLHKAHKFPKIAWKPITCYKVVIPCCYDTCFLTLYTNVLYNLDEPIEHSVKSLGLFKRTLEGEVVHAYVRLNYAQKNTCPYKPIKIVECIIPRFTIYWLGTGGEIGARRLIPLKFI